MATRIRVIPPWLVIATPGNAHIRLDLRLLDRVGLGEAHEHGCELIFTCGDLDAALLIAEGPEAARRLATEAAPWTRDEGGAERPLPLRGVSSGPKRSTGHGRLEILSSTPDGEARPDDRFAGLVYELTMPVMRIGRTDDNDISIAHRSISRVHAEVTRDASTGRYRITDLNTCNGVRVNGLERAEDQLFGGDIIDLGHVRLEFTAPGQDMSDDWVSFAPPQAREFLMVGGDPVLQLGELIQIGAVAFRIDEVEDYAHHGANLPLTGGRELQAAMALLVVAAAERDAPPP